MKKSQSIQRKLISFLLFVSLVPLAATGSVQVFLYQRNLIWSEQYKVTSILIQNRLTTQKLIDICTNDIAALSCILPFDQILSLLGRKDISAEKEGKSLGLRVRAFMQTHFEGVKPKFSRISILDSSGRELVQMRSRDQSEWEQAGKGVLKDYRDDPAFMQIVKNCSAAATPPSPSQVLVPSKVVTATVFDGTPGITLLYPVLNGHGALRCVLAATLSPSFIQSSYIVEHRDVRFRSFKESMYLLNQDGSIIYASEPDAPKAPSGEDRNIVQFVTPDIAKMLFSTFSGTYYARTDWIYEFDSINFKNPAHRASVHGESTGAAEKPASKATKGAPIFVRESARFDSTGDTKGKMAQTVDHLIILIKVSKKDLFATVAFYLRLLQILLASFTILSITTGYYLSRIFIKPIKTLTAGTEEISRGNLDYFLDLKTGDEFETLALHFNTMVERLKEIYANIEQKVVERTEQLAQANTLLEAAKEGVALEKERLEAVLNTTKEGIVMIDPQGALIFANRSFLQIFEIAAADEGESLQLNVLDLVKRREIYKDPDIYQKDLETLLGRQEGVRTGQIVKVFPTPQIIDWFSAPVRQEKGDVLGRIIAFRDVTKEKEVERMKDEFVSIVSHELRTPMTSLGGSLSLVLDGTVGEINEDQKELLEIAKNNTTRLIRLINDILDISKIESGKIKMKSDSVSVPEIVRDSLAGIASFADNYGVSLSSELEDGIPVFEGDHDRLIQVITNLLSNAIKFSPRGGTVHLKAWQGDGMLHMSVRDEGIGIPPEYLDKIFEKFQQVDSSAVREKGGTGLGLPICKAIVEEHGGAMWVESESGRGSTFTFKVPLNKPS
jgi:PAS domain S-box-containing protein